jgi:hypothetical protein
MNLVDHVHHLIGEVKTLAAAPALRDGAAAFDAGAVGGVTTLSDAGAVVSGVRDLLLMVQALQVVVMAHLSASDAFRAHGAHDVASMLRLSGESPFVAKQVGSAVRATGAFASIAGRLLDGSMRREHAAAMAVLIEHVDAGWLHTDEIDRLLASAARDTVDSFKQQVAQLQLLAEQRAGLNRAERQRAKSRLTVSDADDGMKKLIAELDPARHAVVVNALDEIVDQHWRDPHRAPGTYELSKLRADALFEMAQRSIEGRETTIAEAVHHASPSRQNRSSKSGSTDSPTRTGRAQVVVLIDHQTLVDGLLREGSRCELADGTPISPETARRLACEAGVISAVLGSPSEPLDVGRRRRLATPAQRIALRLRSRTCEFPSCTVPHEWTKAHHVNPRKPGGLTDLEQLVALCTKHHGLVHEGSWTIERIDGVTVFRTPSGIAYNEPIAHAACALGPASTGHAVHLRGQRGQPSRRAA